MKNYDWHQFVKRITLRSSPEKIYRSWASQQGLETWFLRLAEFKSVDGTVRERNEAIQKGDRYNWLWFGYDDTFAEQGEIISANGRDQLQFTFSGGCLVTVQVKQENGQAICELQQLMPMESELEQRHFFIECGKGWTFYMTNLKSILEGGVDLRNKDENIQNLINA